MHSVITKMKSFAVCRFMESVRELDFLMANNSYVMCITFVTRLIIIALPFIDENIKVKITLFFNVNVSVDTNVFT